MRTLLEEPHRVGLTERLTELRQDKLESPLLTKMIAAWHLKTPDSLL